ncbi:hypothetical protein B0J17DRAFT_640000 [Rhizoctonia solani]|nr:hypothetical protein B0J17DRAFT_640000 [Rhizoctonia solani]
MVIVSILNCFTTMSSQFLQLGVATTAAEYQSMLLTRLWGVSECNRPETIGNDIVRMLKDIWELTTKRPAVWADLRTACWRVTRI